MLQSHPPIPEGLHNAAASVKDYQGSADWPDPSLVHAATVREGTVNMRKETASLASVCTIFVLSSAGALLLFRLLESQAKIEGSWYEAGGAMAGFVLLYLMLHRSYCRIVRLQEPCLSGKQTLDLIHLFQEDVKYQILNSRDCWYFLIKRTQDSEPLGRFYYRAWRFQSDPYWIDWELNIIIADPSNRGKGYGTAVQALAAEFLLQFPTTLSVFAYTPIKNIAEQRALEKAGFKEEGLIPISYYRVPEPRDETLRQCVLYVRRNEL